MIKEQDFEVNSIWLIENHFSSSHWSIFDDITRGRCKISKLLQMCEEKNLCSFAERLIEKLPINPEPLVLTEYTGGNIFYNGDVFIQKDFECSGNIVCKNLIVNGEITIGKCFRICANVTSEKLSVKDCGYIKGDQIRVIALDMQDCGRVDSNVRAQFFSMSQFTRTQGRIETRLLKLRDRANIIGEVIIARI